MYKLGFNCAKFMQFRHLAAVVELIKPKFLKSYTEKTEKTCAICRYLLGCQFSKFSQFIFLSLSSVFSAGFFSFRYLMGSDGHKSFSWWLDITLRVLVHRSKYTDVWIASRRRPPLVKLNMLKELILTH